MFAVCLHNDYIGALIADARTKPNRIFNFQTVFGVMEIIQKFFNPQLPDDFFWLCGAVFIAGKAFQIRLAVLLENLRFKPLDIFGFE